MDILVNQIKQLANMENIGKAYIRPGVIQNYDPTLYRVKVLLPPEDVVTGWIPLTSWGEIMPPKINTQVTVLFINGDLNNGIVLGKVFSRANPPPTDSSVTQPGSFLLKTKNGTVIKITNSGQIEVNAIDGQSIVVDSDTNVLIGDTTQVLKRLVKETIKDLYNQHEHPGPNMPPKPAYLITDNDLTRVLEGN